MLLGTRTVSPEGKVTLSLESGLRAYGYSSSGLRIL
jgi:hypothetical protein